MITKTELTMEIDAAAAALDARKAPREINGRALSIAERIEAIGTTVREAGARGGTKLAAERGHEFYVEIGTKGGHRVRDLIAAGRRATSR